jgi:ATP-dependent DNA helicase DinG
MSPAPDSLSELVALVPAPPGAAICGSAGDCHRVDRARARDIFQSGNALVAHAAFVAGRLKAPAAKPLYDVLELFAFVRPGQPLVPSALGLARALMLKLPATPEESADALFAVARRLLEDARAMPPDMRAQLAPLAATLARGGWRWGPLLQTALGMETPHGSPIAGMEAWRGLPQWEDETPVGTPGSQPVTPDEARAPCSGW